MGSVVGDEWVIPLHVPKTNRAGDLAVALLVLVFAVPFLFGMIAIIIGLFPTIWGGLATGVVGAVLILLMASVGQQILRAFKPYARIRLLPDELEIDHPLRFRRSCRIPKAQVEAVLIDVQHTPAPDLGEAIVAVASSTRKLRERFPILDGNRLDPALKEEKAVPTYLFSKNGSPLPLVMTELKDTPNLAVIFRHPQNFPTARSGFLFESSSWEHVLGTADLHVPSRRRPASGFLTRAVDTHRAFSAFDAWGILPQSHASAPRIAHALPTRTEVLYDRTKRRLFLGGFLFVVVIGRVVAEVLTS